MAPEYPRGWDAERIQALARNLHEVAGKPTADGTLSRWLHGPKYTDVFVDFAPGGRIVRVEVSFGGYFLLWDGVQLHTGLTDELEIEAFGAPKSRFIREHASPDPAITRGVHTLLSAIEDKYLAASVLAVLPPPPPATPPC